MSDDDQRRERVFIRMGTDFWLAESYMQASDLQHVLNIIHERAHRGPNHSQLFPLKKNVPCGKIHHESTYMPHSSFTHV
jgi:hypothetical protein